MSVFSHECPHTSLEISSDDYYRLMREVDPITLEPFNELKQPVVIGTDTRKVYELQDLLKVTQRQYRVNKESQRGVNDKGPACLLNTETRNPYNPSQNYKVSNILAIHYNFEDSQGRNINNDDIYGDTDEYLWAYSHLRNDERQKLANIFSYVHDEREVKMTQEELYPIVKNFMDEYIENLDGAKRVAIYANFMFQIFRETIRRIDPSNHAVRQSDDVIERSFNTYIVQNKTKIKKGNEKIFEYTNDFYIINPIDMFEIVRDFCISQPQPKVLNEIEIIEEFKAFMIAKEIGFKDYPDQKLISLINRALSIDICSQHITEDTPMPGSIQTEKKYWIGRNIVSMDDSVRRMSTRQNPGAMIAHLQMEDQPRSRRGKRPIESGGKGSKSGRSLHELEGSEAISPELRNLINGASHGERGGMWRYSSQAPMGGGRDARLSEQYQSFSGIGRELSPPPAYDPNRESTLPLDGEDTADDIRARHRTNAALLRRFRDSLP